MPSAGSTEADKIVVIPEGKLKRLGIMVKMKLLIEHYSARARCDSGNRKISKFSANHHSSLRTVTIPHFSSIHFTRRGGFGVLKFRIRHSPKEGLTTTRREEKIANYEEVKKLAGEWILARSGLIRFGHDNGGNGWCAY